MSKFLFNTPVVATAGVYNKMTQEQKFNCWVTLCLVKHFSGDYGSIPTEEIEMNNEAIKNNIDRIFSVYVDDFGTKIYVITDGIPRQTTVLFPSEY